MRARETRIHILIPQMKSIHLTGQDREDLVAFLQSLTGNDAA